MHGAGSTLRFVPRWGSAFSPNHNPNPKLEVGLCIQSHRAPLRAAFQLFDAAGTGKVSLEDFKIAMECLNDVTGGGGGGLREAHALHLGGAAEKDADGKVDYNKWLDGFAAQRV